MIPEEIHTSEFQMLKTITLNMLSELKKNMDIAFKEIIKKKILDISEQNGNKKVIENF